MSGPSPTKPADRRLERAALATGIVAAAILVAAGLRLWGAARDAGRAALERTLGELGTTVELAWGRLVDRPEQVLGLGARTHRWREAERAELRRPPGADPQPLARASRDDAAHVLFREAELEAWARSDPASALGTAQAALDAGAEGSLRAATRHLAMRCALETGDREQARDQWEALSAEATGAETREGLSILLMAGLRWGAGLEGDELRELRAFLEGRWGEGGLALPQEVPRIGRDPTDRPVLVLPTELEVLIEELQALLPDESMPAVEEDARRRRLRALDGLLGGLPATPAHEPMGFRRVDDENSFAWHAATADECRGALIAAQDLTTLLAEAVRGELADRGGFEPDFLGDEEALGEAVRPWSSLHPSGIGFCLRHPDPAAFVREKGRTLELLHYALLALAAFALFAGFVSFQALGRQRRLQALKADFVAGVSHELRTPITAILLATESLAAGRDRTPERRQRYVGILQREARRLKRLVEDVLDFSRLERGPALRREEMELGGFAHELLEESRATVEAASRQFEGHAPDLQGSATLDGEALRRAIGNLVDNALIHGGGDLVRLEIELEGEGSGRALVLRVIDRGRGIPPEARARVFDAFRQLGARSVEGKARGAGLGLAIVRQIVQAHGGTVGVGDGADGRGTCFEVRLPTEIRRGEPRA